MRVIKIYPDASPVIMDKEMALRYWKRLNGDERMMAVASISVYLDSKPRSRWRTAMEYLGYKSFLPDLN